MIGINGTLLRNPGPSHREDIWFEPCSMNQNSERPIELVAIINSFNRRSLLERALGSLTEALRSARFPSAIIVFEAGSNDGSSEFLNAWRENHSGANFVLINASPDRRSFSDGVNIGCAEAIARFPQCRWLLLYETDNCLTNPEPLEQGMSLLKQDAQLAAAGFTVKQHDGKFYGYGMRFPTRSEEHTSELQSPDHLVCRLL